MQTSKINKTNIVRRATQPVPIGRSFEAVKLLSDWTKWLVTIETASIAALGFVLKASELNLIKGAAAQVALLLAVLAVIFFLISIALASRLILYIPTLVELLPEPSAEVTKVEPLWLTDIPFWPYWKVDTYATWHLRAFSAGLVCFASTVIMMAVSPR